MNRAPGGTNILRSILVCGIVAALVPLLSGTSAHAGPPSELGGVAWNDINADGIQDANEPMFAGAVLTVIDTATGLPVGASATTAADGTYLFSSLPAGDYRIDAASPQNYWISPTTADNAYAPTGTGGTASEAASSPTYALDGANSVANINIAVRPRPELSLGTFGPGVLDGGPEFNTLGNCANPVASPTPSGSPEWSDSAAPGQVPGEDCGSSNGVVRTQDAVATVWSITADNYEPGAPDLDAVIFEQIIHPVGNAVVDFQSIPVSCRPAPNGTGGATPASAVTYDDPNPGDVKLTCNLGSFPEGFQESLTTFLAVSGESSNGSSFTAEQRVYSATSAGVPNAVPDSSAEIGPIEISAAPAYDVAKNVTGLLNYGTLVRDMKFDDHLPSCDSNPQPCNIGPEKGRYGYFQVALSAERSTGIEGLAQPITLEDSFSSTTDTPAAGTAYNFEFEIDECRWNPSGWGNTVYGRWVDDTASVWYNKSVLDSGTCAPQRSDPTDPTSDYEFVLDDIDMSGDAYPQQRYNGADLSAGPYYVAMHRVRVFIPFRTIDLSDGVADGVGAINVSNCIDNFDPDSVSGVSNYGTGTEPGYNRGLMPDGTGTNNCVGPTTFQMTTNGGFSKYNYKYIGSNGYPYQASGNTSHTGSHTYEPGQTFVGVVWNNNSGTNDLFDPRACDVFDNTTLKLTTAERVGQNGWTPSYLPAGSYAYVNNGYSWNSNNDPADFVVEYASADFGTDDPLSGGYDSVSSRYEGDWSVARDFRCEDNYTVTKDGSTYGLAAPNAAADPDGDGWTTDPTAFPGGVDDVNMVRAHFVSDTIPLESTDRMPLTVPLELRSVFNGGPHNGELIPAGTVMPNFGGARWSYYDDDRWTARYYKASPETTHGDGDRVTLTRAQLRIAKHTLEPATDVGKNGAVLAGFPIVWEMIPTLTSQLDEPAPIQDLTVTDVLPPEVTYNAACTAARADGTPPALVEPNTPNPGETTLTWFFGDWTPNTDIPRLVICTDSDPLAPNGTAVVNSTSVTATGVAYNHLAQEDTHTIVLEQAGSIQLSKEVDITLDDQNDSQEYTLEWSNFAPAFLIASPTVIDVLPWNGDGPGASSERDPGSLFHGALDLTGAPTITWLDDSTPTGADPHAELGVWSYTNDAPATIDYNPDLNTSNWCTEAQFGTAGCPADFAAVTAIKFDSNYALERDGNPRQGMRAKFTLQAGDPSASPDPSRTNRPGDLYTNRFALDTTSLEADQYLRSNNVSVEVAAYSIGDFVFTDVNGNGQFDVGLDVPAPDGVTVELRDGDDDSLIATTTIDSTELGAGRYLFDLLSSGDYYVVLPETNFTTGSLAGWYETTIPGGAVEDDDANETADQHGYSPSGLTTDGLRTNTLTLSGNPPLPGGIPTGNEPLADNSGLIADSTNDDFSNLTLDLGLVGPSAIEIQKEICVLADVSTCDVENDDQWAETSEIGYYETARWRITIVNTGLQTLTDVTVTDTIESSCDRDSADIEDLAEMNPGDTVAYTCDTTQVLAETTNTAEVVGTPVAGPDPTDSDPASLTLSEAAPTIVIEKATNTVDADTAPGVYIEVGDAVQWTYVVNNTGNMPLSNVSVVDDMGTPSDDTDDTTMTKASAEYVGGDTDGDDLLDLTETWTFRLDGTATEGQYTNDAVVTGKPILPGAPDVTDNDPSNYVGLGTPGIDLEKATNAADQTSPATYEDADASSGPSIETGGPVVWSYLVTTDGSEVPLNRISVTDDNGTATLGDDFQATYVSGDDGDNLLESGETWLFTATGTATAGAYENTATAAGYEPTTTHPDGSSSTNVTPLTATDLSHYFGTSADIEIVKYVNDDDANAAPGESLIVGSTALFTYEVTNTGDVALIDIEVGDDQGVVVSCPASVLAPSESMTCTGSDTVTAGGYINIGDVVGTPAVEDPTDPGTLIPMVNIDGTPVTKPTDNDPANYTGAAPSISIVKSVNGVDADTAPGAAILAGDTAAFTYLVTNDGTSHLSDITVVDDQGVIVTCPATSLAPTESMTCTGSATAIAEQYTNIGTTEGTPSTPDVDGTLIPIVNGDGTPVDKPTDSNPANYFGYTPGLEIVKSANGDDANTAPGIEVAAGSLVAFTYEVTNTGDSALMNISVGDDQDVVVTCPATELDSGESMTCTGSATAVAGQYTNIGDVTGTPAVEDGSGDLTPIVDETGTAVDNLTDDDPANYYGLSPAVEVIKTVNGDDANTAPGIDLSVGDSVAFEYEVTNSGDSALMDIVVSDDQGVDVTCPATELDSGESMICTGTSTVTAGDYVNIGDVVGTPAIPDDNGDLTPLVDGEGKPVDKPTADDPANYHGFAPAIDIVKYVNGHNANEAPGVAVIPGETVSFSYEVTNTGDVALIDVSVTDDQGVVVTCPVDTLLPTESTTCTGSAVAVADQYTNIGEATGTPATDDGTGTLTPILQPDGTPTDKLTADDPANYFGAEPAIDITKYVEGHDANEPGLTLPIGSDITWTYVVTNAGNTWLSNVGVADDQGVVVTCPSTVLAPGESMTCTGTGIAVSGPYVNIGEAIGEPTLPDDSGTQVPLTDTDGEPFPPVVDSDPANNFGFDNGVTIKKYIFGEDAPVDEVYPIAARGAADFTYVVTNTGNTWLTEISIADDMGVEVTCPKLELEPGEEMTCAGTGPVPAGDYTNVGEVTATPAIPTPSGLVPVTDPDTQEPVEPLTDADDANAFGEDPSILVTKVGCYQGACGEGISVPDSGTITWKIDVTNNGNVDLTDIVVSDQLVGECNTTIPALAVGETEHITCEASARVGRTNTVSVSGTPVTSIPLGTTDRPVPSIEVSSAGTASVTTSVPTSVPRILAFTGTGSGIVARLGLLLLAAGAGFTLIGRRKRQQA